MKVFGQLEAATFEILASDPGTSVQGRFWFNSVSGMFKTDDGTDQRALLRNDAQAIIGNSGTAVDNIRLHRGGAGVIQLVLGSDVTAEGSLSSALNQLSARIENYTDAGKPAFGNAGRLVWITDQSKLLVDTGAAYKAPWTFDQLAPSTTKGDLIVHSGLINDRLPIGVDGTFLQADSGEPLGVKWSSSVDNKVVTSVITTYLALVTDDVILASDSGGSYTITLFTAVGNDGKTLIIKKTTNTTNVITIDGNGGETIDGATTTTLNTEFESVELVSDGANWTITNRNSATGWTLFGTNIITGTTSNPSKGTTFNDKLWWRRNGVNMEVRIEYRQTGAGSAGSGDYQFQMPTNYLIDTTKLVVDTTVQGSGQFKSDNVVGTCMATDGTNTGTGVVVVWSSSLVRLMITGALPSAGYGGCVGSGFTGLNFASVNYAATFSVPISGWKA